MQVNMPVSPFDPCQDVTMDEVECIIQGVQVAPQYYEFPINVFENKDIPAPHGMQDEDIFAELSDALFGSNTSQPETQPGAYEDTDDAMVADLSDALFGEETDQSETQSGVVQFTPEVVTLPVVADPVVPLPPVFAPVVNNAVFQQTLFSTDSFITPENTKGEITKAQHAFNLLGCIVYMARFPTSQEGWDPIFKVYGYRANIVSQVSWYVSDPKNGVVHNQQERSVTINRGSLYGLVKGNGDIVDENDRILSHFGNMGKNVDIKDPNVRKYFSGLKTAWDTNVKKGETNSFLNSFEYIIEGPKKCYFKFLY